MTELDRLQICFQKSHHFFISTEIKPTQINHNEPLQSWMTTRPPIPQYIMKSYLSIRDCLESGQRKFSTSISVQDQVLFDVELYISTMNVVTSDVVHHLKLLLSYVVKDKTFNEVYHFTDEQILFHIS